MCPAPRGGPLLRDLETMASSNRSGKRQVLANALASWSGFAAQVVAAFLTTPIIIRGLGDDRYGVWSLIESILAYLMLLDLGLTASVVYYIAKFEATDNHEDRNRVF